MKKEKFVDIEGYEDRYQVSTYGNVKSLNYLHTGREKLLKPQTDGSGYLFVTIYKDGKREQLNVHKLVAQAFIPNPLSLPQVNHKDEDKTNNRVENLEWCTSAYNNNYGTHNQRVAEALTNGRTSKPVYQYSLDGALVAKWPSANEAGRNGFSNGNISLCCNNKYLREGNNEYKGYIWKYD